MSFPLPYICRYSAYAGTGEDALGNEIPAWAAPVELPCFLWSPSSAEPAVAGHDRVVVDVVLVVDASADIRPRGRVTLDGNPLGSDPFEVIGYPEDYEHGPYWAPGRKPVNLRRVEG